MDDYHFGYTTKLTQKNNILAIITREISQICLQVKEESRKKFK
jgi:hypothetical protein